MKYLFLGIMIMSFSLTAQVLDEKTLILNKAGGERIFELEERQEVYSYEPEDDWYKIRKACYIEATDLIDEKYLNAGTMLLDKDGNEIGKVFQEIKVKDKKKIEHFRKKDQYEVVLEGFIFKTAIERGTIPEKKLEELLQMKNRTEQDEGFLEFFNVQRFEERSFEDLTAYVLRERNKSTGEEQDFRLIVIRRTQGSLYAIITNGHHVEVPKIKDEFEEGSFKVSYFYKPTSSQRELVQNRILYTYLAL